MNADGSAQTQLTVGNLVNNPVPSWSPDGSRIAYGGVLNGVQGIVVMKADGSGKTALTSGNDDNPYWSRDGARVLFTRFVSTNADLYLVNADGTNLVNLTPMSPAWDLAGYGVVPWSP